MAFNCSNFCHIGSKSESNADNELDSASQGSDVSTSPPGSAVTRRRTFWSNFKSRTRKLRSRSADSSGHHSRGGESKATPKTTAAAAATAESKATPKTTAAAAATAGVQDAVDMSSIFQCHPDQTPPMASRARQLVADLEDLDTVYEFPVTLSVAETGRDALYQPTDTTMSPLVESRARGSAYSCSFFIMDIVLKDGRDLVVKDSCGTSDPYVKFKIGNRQYYKSRTVLKNLNPKWDERFSLPIDDLSKVIQVKVFDYDRGLNDDPMGSAIIDPNQLESNVPTEMKLMLSDDKKKNKGSQYMGYIGVNCTLIPKSQDDVEQYLRNTARAGAGSKKLKSQLWSAVVSIVLIEGRHLIPMDDNGLSDPYVKFRLGNERYKSKYKVKTLNPRWLEQFDLYLFEDQTSHLEIFVYDHDVGGRDDLMGRAELDLNCLDLEKTHDIEQPLEDAAGIIHVLLTLSATVGFQSPSDLVKAKFSQWERDDIVRKYGLLNSFKDVNDVGWLMVKVYRAQGLSAADIGGKSDPYCVLELGNCRLQTQTEYKTLAPEWNKVFTLPVFDIHSVLELTIYDEDKDKKSEFLGKVAMPLLRIKNRERRWLNLKDQKLFCAVKGSIEVELDLIYNDIKATIRTLNPREEKYLHLEPRFKVALMRRNIKRVAIIVDAILRFTDFIESCFNWKSKFRSILAFWVFVTIVWNFELYMIPLTLLIIFLTNLTVVEFGGGFARARDTEQEFMGVDEDEDEDEREPRDEKKVQSLREKLQSVQDVCLQVQESMDMAACLGERIKNAFMWHMPWLSVLAMIMLCLLIIVLHCIPLRCLVLAWGVVRFSRRFRVGNTEPNNELLDYLSRLPSDKELSEFREIKYKESPLITTKRKS